jgi:type III pantothenate kinase
MAEPLQGPVPLIAVDIGNSRMKWGLFIFGRPALIASLPPADQEAWDRQIDAWTPGARVNWAVSSVNPENSESFLAWIRLREFSPPVVLDDPSLLPLRVGLDRPQGAGIDRLLNAVAVNDRRPSRTPAVIVDAGSAITVDAVSADGAFLGGTIAIGLALAARGLHEFTYWLPQLSVTAAPPAVGKSTAEAMQSGLFWGTVGAVKELIARVAANLPGEPVVYLTGGDSELLAPHLARPVERVPELTLHGIHLAYRHVRSRQQT